MVINITRNTLIILIPMLAHGSTKWLSAIIALQIIHDETIATGSPKSSDLTP